MGSGKEIERRAEAEAEGRSKGTQSLGSMKSVKRESMAFSPPGERQTVGLSRLLKQWDSSSHRSRAKLLESFISAHRRQTGPQLEAVGIESMSHKMWKGFGGIVGEGSGWP